MVVFVINFIFNIKRYNLLKFSKWPVLMLHISWILIILGAFVTRYIGYEGVMPIRENLSSNSFIDRCKALVDAGVDAIVIDTAHGHFWNVLRFIFLFKLKISIC